MTVFLLTVRRYVRDPGTLVLQILFPVCLTFLLGRSVTLEGSFEPMQYYAVSVLVFFSMFIALYSAESAFELWLCPAGRRLRAAAPRPALAVVQIIVAAPLFGIATAAIHMLATTALLPVDWGNSFVRPGAVAAALALCSSGIGFVLVGVTGSLGRSTLIIHIIAYAGTVSAEGFFPLEAAGRRVEFLSRFAPQWYAQRAYFDVVRSEPWGVFAGELMILAFAGTVATVFGVYMLERRSR